MANRILRDWTDSEKIDNLSAEAERMFVRIMMKADDFGYFHANEKLLLAALFPLKVGIISPNIISEWLLELEKAELIVTYIANDRKYLKINNFGQRLRKMVSRFPQIADNPPTIDRNPPPETETETEDETETEENTKNVETKEAEKKNQAKTVKPIQLSNVARFESTLTDQEAVFKFARSIGKIKNKEELKHHTEIHDNGIALSKPGSDYKTWLQYFRYYFENLKVNGKIETIAKTEPDPPYLRKVKFDENGKPITN